MIKIYIVVSQTVGHDVQGGHGLWGGLPVLWELFNIWLYLFVGLASQYGLI
jgi:hypothetical protein